MIYLLDSNVWVAILRQKVPQVAVRYGATNRADIRTCSMVVAELWYGCSGWRPRCRMTAHTCC